jgi:hypothetical protein
VTGSGEDSEQLGLAAVVVLTLLSVWYYRRKGNVFERELQALATMEKS